MDESLYFLLFNDKKFKKLTRMPSERISGASPVLDPIFLGNGGLFGIVIPSTC